MGSRLDVVNVSSSFKWEIPATQIDSEMFKFLALTFTHVNVITC